MNIDSVNSSSGIYSNQANKNNRKSPGKETDAAKSSFSNKTDKLELSDEARKLKPIQQRIESGYYDKPEVMKEIAKQISFAFPPEV
jgi:DNA-directed RNA polymerase specialized sigma subunit